MTHSEQPTVLVVDDDVECAQSLCDLLGELGCCVQARHDGRSAVEAAAVLRPALMIVDLALGSEDGCLLMNTIRDQLPPGDRPVMVCLTGRADPRTEMECLQQGFDLFLGKPLITEALHEVLAVAASRRRWRPQANLVTRSRPLPPPA